MKFFEADIPEDRPESAEVMHDVNSLNKNNVLGARIPLSRYNNLQYILIIVYIYVWYI